MSNNVEHILYILYIYSKSVIVVLTHLIWSSDVRQATERLNQGIKRKTKFSPPTFAAFSVWDNSVQYKHGLETPTV